MHQDIHVDVDVNVDVDVDVEVDVDIHVDINVNINSDVDDDFERIKPATTFTTTETNEVVGVLEKKNENMRRRARRLRGVRERGGVFERFGREIDVVGGRESIIFWRTRRRRRRRQKVQETRSEKDD